MAKNQNKTVQNEASVEAFIAAVPNETKRNDATELLSMMKEITGKPAVMWGSSIIGFGKYHYKYASGREGDWAVTGFSPRKQALTVYIMPGFSKFESMLSKLGKHKLGKSCLYINKLADIDREVLREMIYESVQYMQTIYQTE